MSGVGTRLLIEIGEVCPAATVECIAEPTSGNATSKLAGGSGEEQNRLLGEFVRAVAGGSPR
jgi:hypothetical protein